MVDSGAALFSQYAACVPGRLAVTVNSNESTRPLFQFYWFQRVTKQTAH